MKKNAFTLAELVAVVVLLGLITAIAFPPIITQMKKSQESIDNATEKLIISGAMNYLKSNKDDYPELNGSVYCITVGDLIDNNNLSSSLKNSDGEEIPRDEKVKVRVKNNNYEYEIVNTCVESR